MAHKVDLAAYKEDGFCIVREVFHASAIRNIAAAFEDLKYQARDFTDDTFVGPTYFNLHRDCDPFDKKVVDLKPVSGELRRVTYPYLVSEVLNTYRVFEPLLRCAEKVLGPDIVQLVNQANFNPPKRGTGWGWHQDYRFRRKGLSAVPKSFVQCLLAVDECNEENGGLRLVRKSDSLGPLQLDTMPEQFDQHVNPSMIVQPLLRSGDIILFNPYIIHGSTPNRTDRERRVYINGFAATSAVTHGIPVLQNGIVLPTSSGIMEFEDDPARLPPVVKY